jgi:hypothetical protein
MTDAQIHETIIELEHQYAELLAADAAPGELSALWSQILYFRELLGVEA